MHAFRISLSWLSCVVLIILAKERRYTVISLDPDASGCLHQGLVLSLVTNHGDIFPLKDLVALGGHGSRWRSRNRWRSRTWESIRQRYNRELNNWKWTSLFADMLLRLCFNSPLGSWHSDGHNSGIVSMMILGRLCTESLSLTSSLCLTSRSVNSTTTRRENVATLWSGDKLRLKVSNKLSKRNLPIILSHVISYIEYYSTENI